MAKSKGKSSGLLKKPANYGKLEFRASLEFTLRPKRLYAITLEATNEKGIDFVEELMDGKIKGLEYCEIKTIKAIAGGAGSYVLDLNPERPYETEVIDYCPLNPYK